MKSIMLVATNELKNFAIETLKIPKQRINDCDFLNDVDCPRYWELDILVLVMYFLPIEYENYNCDNDFKYIEKFESLTYKAYRRFFMEYGYLEYFIVYKFLIANKISEMMVM